MRQYKESATGILEEVYNSGYSIEPLFPNVQNVSVFSYYLNFSCSKWDGTWYEAS